MLGQEKFLCQQKFWIQNIIGSKDNFGVKILCRKSFGSTDFWVQKILGLRNIQPKKFQGVPPFWPWPLKKRCLQKWAPDHYLWTYFLFLLFFYYSGIGVVYKKTRAQYVKIWPRHESFKFEKNIFSKFSKNLSLNKISINPRVIKIFSIFCSQYYPTIPFL